ncbi:MAG: PsbP-related protein [Bacteroidota bacterium]
MKSNILLAALLVLFVIGCQPKKPDPVPVGEMTEYRDPGYGFKIKYPKDWLSLGQMGNAVFAKSQDVVTHFQDFKSGVPGGMVNVVALDLTGKKPDELIQSNLDELKQAAQMDAAEQITVNGKQGTKYPYIIKVTTKNSIIGYQVYFVGDTALYKLDFQGYGDQFEAHAAVFAAILNSFELPVIVARKSDVWQPSPNISAYNSDYLTMQYPENMNFAPVKKGDKDLVMEMRADRQDCSIHIDVFGAKKLTVEKVWDQNKGKYKSRGSGESTIDGNKTFWVDYSLVKDINSRAYFTVKNDKVIRITMNWYAPQKDIYFTTFEKSVTSIKLK